MKSRVFYYYIGIKNVIRFNDSIYVFLPVVLLLHLCSKKELHNPILLWASIVFYAWREPKYLAIMLLAIIINYTGAVLIENKPQKFRPFFRRYKDLPFLSY